MTKIQKVAVIGAGTMGHSLAQAFAQGGCDVWLNDVRDGILEKAKNLISSNLKTMEDLHVLEANQSAAILDRIHTTSKIETAVENAQFVIEAIIEDSAAKKKLFVDLDRLSPPEAILASNTSYLDIFKFVETGRPDKVLITHWFAPAHLIPLVEVVRGPQTSTETLSAVKAFLLQLGKKPIMINKFLPGFIANRLQSALRLEAHFLLDNGYTTPEEIDEASKASFGLRIPILGLMKREDFAGLDLIKINMNNRLYQPPEVTGCSKTLDRLIEQGRLGVKSGSGFYDYQGQTAEELMRDRDIKLIKLQEFLKELDA